MPSCCPRPASRPPRGPPQHEWQTQTAALAYDPETHLTQVTAPAPNPVATYGYNGDGLRAWKQVGPSTGSRTYFLDDGSQPVVELDSTGSVVQASNTFGANGLLSRRAGSASTFYTFDPQGNVCQRFNSTAAVLSTDMYDAYGLGQRSPSGITDVFGFGAQAGYYTDTETGLLLLTNRYYDPGTGRFLTRDPSGYAGGMNRYRYARNNPIRFGDPSGLIAEDAPDADIEAVIQHVQSGYDQFWCGVNQVGKALQSGIEVLASLNPVTSLIGTLRPFFCKAASASDGRRGLLRRQPHRAGARCVMGADPARHGHPATAAVGRPGVSHRSAAGAASIARIGATGRAGAALP